MTRPDRAALASPPWPGDDELREMAEAVGDATYLNSPKHTALEMGIIYLTPEPG